MLRLDVIATRSVPVASRPRVIPVAGYGMGGAFGYPGLGGDRGVERIAGRALSRSWSVAWSNSPR